MRNLALQVVGCVTSSRPLRLCEPSFPHPEDRVLTAIPSKVAMRIKCNNAHKTRGPDHCENAREVSFYSLEPWCSKGDPETAASASLGLVESAVSAACICM